MEKVTNLNDVDVLKLISDLIDKEVDFDIKISVRQSGTNNLIVISQSGSLEETIEDLLKYIGVPEDLLGYTYIKEAMIITYNKKSLKHDVVKGIYMPVAEKMGSTPSRVERAIRHAIKTTFNKSKHSKERDDLFGHIIDKHKSTPTNSQFLAVLTSTVQKRVKV